MEAGWRLDAGGFDHNICYPLLSAPVLAPLVSVCLGGRSATGGWTRSGGEQLSGRSWQLAAAGAAQLSAVIPPYQYNTRAAAAAGPTLPDTRLHMRALKNINLTVGCEYKEFLKSDINVHTRALLSDLDPHIFSR